MIKFWCFYLLRSLSAVSICLLTLCSVAWSGGLSPIVSNSTELANGDLTESIKAVENSSTNQIILDSQHDGRQKITKISAVPSVALSANPATDESLRQTDEVAEVLNEDEEVDAALFASKQSLFSARGGDKSQTKGLTPLSSVDDMLIGLFVVLVIILSLSWLVKKLKLPMLQKATRLEVLSSVSVGSKEKLLVVKAGDREILLGVTSGGISLLSELSQHLGKDIQDNNRDLIADRNVDDAEHVGAFANTLKGIVATASAVNSNNRKSAEKHIRGTYGSSTDGSNRDD